MKSRAIRPLSIAAAIIAFSSISEAQIASDNADDSQYQTNFDAWTNGDNGGVGFGAWTGLLDQYVGGSGVNGDGANNGLQTVDSPVNGESWALRGTAGGPGEAIRPLSQSLQVGQSFVLEFDNGYVTDNHSVGFGLQTSSGGNVFEFFFTGGRTNYHLQGTSQQDTIQGFTDDGMRTTFTLLTATTYQFTVDFFNATAVDQVLTGDLSGGVIDKVRFFNFSESSGSGSSGHAFYNDMSVVPVPEPSTWAAGILSVLVLGFTQRRRLAGIVGRK